MYPQYLQILIMYEKKWDKLVEPELNEAATEELEYSFENVLQAQLHTGKAEWQ